jgi:hypothetical protein
VEEQDAGEAEGEEEEGEEEQGEEERKVLVQPTLETMFHKSALKANARNNANASKPLNRHQRARIARILDRLD